MRGQVQPKKSAPPDQKASQASNAAKVKTLLQEVKKLRAENQGLRQHLEDAHGRALYADEQAERHKREVEALKAENAELNNLLNQYRSQDATAHASNVISLPQRTTIATKDKASQIQIEMTNLGIKLNSTLIKVIESAPEDIVLTALEALKEAMTASVIKNPAGWLKRAIEDVWQPNNNHTQTDKENELKLFNEWFPLARSQGLVVASTQRNGEILVLTANEEWLSFSELVNRCPIEAIRR